MNTLRRHPTLKAAAIVTAGVLLLSAGCGSDKYPDPASVFEATFQTTGGVGITVLQADGWVWRDSSHCYLRFKATAVSLSVLRGPGFVAITAREYQDMTQGGGICGPMPPWWNPPADRPTVFFRSNIFHPGFHRGQAVGAYNPESQVVNFYWDGVD